MVKRNSKRLGLLCGLWLLAILNGIPGVNLSQHVQSGLIVTAIIALSIPCLVRGMESYPLSRYINRSCFLLAVWWVITLVRSVLAGIPLKSAALLCEQYIFFALLLPVLCVFVKRHRTMLPSVFVLLMLGAEIYALALIISNVGHKTMSVFLHGNVNTYGGGVRIYSPMTDLLWLCLAVCLGRVVALPGRREKHRRALAAVPLLVALAFQQTRAIYFALVVGFIVVMVVLLLGSRERPFAIAAKRHLNVLSYSLLLATIAAVIHPSLVTLIGTRVVRGIAILRHNSGTVGIRTAIAHAMLSALADRWPIGLGFVTPSAASTLGIPGNSILDSDVGMLNILMPMGVVGLVLLYVPVVACFCRSLFLLRRGKRTVSAWHVGSLFWLSGVIATSITLVVLFLASGLVLTASFVACVLSVREDTQELVFEGDRVSGAKEGGQLSVALWAR